MNYQRIYDQLMDRARNRVPDGYVERHHVLPSCMGGSDETANLVSLYPEEHFVAHVLLVKIYPEHDGLIFAVNRMTHGHKGHRKRKMYGWLKRRFSEAQSLLARNQKYITNDHITVCVGLNDTVPTGWRLGRSKTENRIGVNNSHRDTIYINNGVTNRRIQPDSNIPDGWVAGMTSNSKLRGQMNPSFGKRWMNDGNVDKLTKEELPVGWQFGRIRRFS